MRYCQICQVCGQQDDIGSKTKVYDAIVGTSADVSQRSRRRRDCRSADKRMRKLPQKIELQANSESTTSREGSICIGSWELKLNSRSATEIMESIGQLDMTDQSPMWAQQSLLRCLPSAVHTRHLAALAYSRLL